MPSTGSAAVVRGAARHGIHGATRSDVHGTTRHGTGRTSVAAIPVAVAQPIVDLVTGPPRRATVMAVHSAAVILACAASEVPPVVTVLAAEASGVPNGVRIATPARRRPFAHLRIGDGVELGTGAVRLPSLSLRAVRVVRTAVPRIRPAAEAVAAIASAARGAQRGVPEGPVADLAGALAGNDAARLREAVTALVGLGIGSTPGGDDVLCGALAGLHATGDHALAGRIAAAALPRLDARTPLLSADLLRLAATGHACSEAVAVVRACTPTRRTALDRAVNRLLAIGHTSGADLATGLAIGLAGGLSVGPAARPVPRPAAPTTHDSVRDVHGKQGALTTP